MTESLTESQRQKQQKEEETVQKQTKISQLENEITEISLTHTQEKEQIKKEFESEKQVQ